MVSTLFCSLLELLFYSYSFENRVKKRIIRSSGEREGKRTKEKPKKSVQFRANPQGNFYEDKAKLGHFWEAHQNNYYIHIRKDFETN